MMTTYFPFCEGIRPFSNAVKAGNFLYVSGQVGIDRTSNTYPESIEEQTTLAIQNLNKILINAGFNLSNVIKITVYIVDSSYLAGFNTVYKSVFTGNLPARTLSIVKALAGQAIVELDAIAYKE